MKSEEIDREWAEIRSRIKEDPTINTSQMNAFFSRIVPQVMSEDYLLLTADNDFIKTWIERHYVDYMHKVLKEMHGVDYVIEIEVDVNQEANRESAAPVITQQPLEPARQDMLNLKHLSRSKSLMNRLLKANRRLANPSTPLPR